MKLFGFFSLAFVILSFFLWLSGWIYWNFLYTMAAYWSTTYVLMIGAGLLAGICAFLSIICLAIGLIVGAKKIANG